MHFYFYFIFLTLELINGFTENDCTLNVTQVLQV